MGDRSLPRGVLRDDPRSMRPEPEPDPPPGAVKRWPAASASGIGGGSTAGGGETIAGGSGHHRRPAARSTAPGRGHVGRGTAIAPPVIPGGSPSARVSPWISMARNAPPGCRMRACGIRESATVSCRVGRATARGGGRGSARGRAPRCPTLGVPEPARRRRAMRRLAAADLGARVGPWGACWPRHVVDGHGGHR